MELEVLEEQIDWEAQRVAAAFGIEEWDVNEVDPLAHRYSFCGQKNSVLIYWQIHRSRPLRWSYLSVGKEDASAECEIFFDQTLWAPHRDEWHCFGHPAFNHIMACGLYRLGFEEKSVLSQLPHLTAHEKLELRLSLPREFWPKRWMEEEAKSP